MVKTEEITFRNTFCPDKRRCFSEGNAARLTARYWVPYLLRFATIRHYSRLFARFALFEAIRTIHTIRYSLFGTIRCSLFGFSRHPFDSSVKSCFQLYLSTEKYFCFALLYHVIGWKISRHFFIQPEVISKAIVTRLHTFSRASRQLHVITSNFDWFTVLSVFLVIFNWVSKVVMQFLWSWFYYGLRMAE